MRDAVVVIGLSASEMREILQPTYGDRNIIVTRSKMVTLERLGEFGNSSVALEGAALLITLGVTSN